jgi:hypothetical protein
MSLSVRIAPAFALLLAMLGSCASTPVATLETDADAKRCESAMNAAIVYLYRPRGPAGDAASTIWVNDRLVGETLPTTFFRVPVRPGRTRITASGGDAGRLEIDTQAEGVYFVEMQVQGDTQSASITSFRRVAPEVAKPAIVGCCRMLDAWRPGQSRVNF